MKLISGMLLVIAALTFSCQQDKPVASPSGMKGWIKVTIFYPSGEGKTFDMDYYSSKHMPMIKRLLGDSVKLITIDKGLSGGMPDTPPAYLAIGYLYFETVSAYRNSIAPHLDEIRADIPKYTNSPPVIQISEVLQ